MWELDRIDHERCAAESAIAKLEGKQKAIIDLRRQRQFPEEISHFALRQRA